MSSFSDAEDDKFLSELELDDIVVIDQPEVEGEAVIVGAAGENDNQRSCSWPQFLSWFEKQTRFDTPWFEAIPVTGLNGIQCRAMVSRLRGCGDVQSLVNFAKILFTFLEEVAEELSSTGGEGDEGEVTTNRGKFGYYYEIVQVFETSLLGIEDALEWNTGGVTCSQQEELYKLYESIVKAYVSGKLDLKETSVPEILARVYPKGLEEILGVSVRTGNMGLLLPLCLKNPENLREVLVKLHFDIVELKSKGDPDFQCDTPQAAKFAHRFMEALKLSLGSQLVNVVPRDFTHLFAFECALTKNLEFLKQKIVQEEVFDALNEIFLKCYDCDKKQAFAEFVISLSPTIFHHIWNDKQVWTKVRFKHWPFLWKFRKNHCNAI